MYLVTQHSLVGCLSNFDSLTPQLLRSGFLINNTEVFSYGLQP